MWPLPCSGRRSELGLHFSQTFGFERSYRPDTAFSDPFVLGVFQRVEILNRATILQPSPWRAGEGGH